MIEDHQTVVNTDVAIGQLEVVDGAARQFWFGKILQFVAPIAKPAAEGKRAIRN